MRSGETLNTKRSIFVKMVIFEKWKKKRKQQIPVIFSMHTIEQIKLNIKMNMWPLKGVFHSRFMTFSTKITFGIFHFGWFLMEKMIFPSKINQNEIIRELRKEIHVNRKRFWDFILAKILMPSFRFFIDWFKFYFLKN